MTANTAEKEALLRALVNAYRQELIDQVKSYPTSLKSCISAFRSIICHNNSDQFPLNEEKVFDAEKWIALHASGIQGLETLNDDNWGTLLGILVGEADSLISDIDTALDTLQNTGDVCRRECAIERWIQQIAFDYKNKPGNFVVFGAETARNTVK